MANQAPIQVGYNPCLFKLGLMLGLIKQYTVRMLLQFSTELIQGTLLLDLRHFVSTALHLLPSTCYILEQEGIIKDTKGERQPATANTGFCLETGYQSPGSGQQLIDRETGSVMTVLGNGFFFFNVLGDRGIYNQIDKCLSEKIQRQTHVLIHPHSLRRILFFNVCLMFFVFVFLGAVNM